jgi:DNA-directed RNA polymerase specialized sigma24 family protein
MQDNQVQELLNAVALHSDRQSYKKLYMLYYNKLFCLAKSFIKSIEGAEEIVDDAFLSIWLKRAQLLEINNFTAYIYATIRNSL